MKKLLIIFLSLFLFLPAMGEYIPIEKSKSKEYKKEIEQVIDSKVPIYKKQIVKLFDEFKEEQKQSQLKTDDEYTLLWDEIVFKLYFDLIDITEKYVGKNIIYGEFGSEDFADLYYAMKPYFKDNKINTSKINALFKYIKTEHKKLKKIPALY